MSPINRIVQVYCLNLDAFTLVFDSLAACCCWTLVGIVPLVFGLLYLTSELDVAIKRHHGDDAHDDDQQQEAQNRKVSIILLILAGLPCSIIACLTLHVLFKTTSLLLLIVAETITNQYFNSLEKGLTKDFSNVMKLLANNNQVLSNELLHTMETSAFPESVKEICRNTYYATHPNLTEANIQPLSTWCAWLFPRREGGPDLIIDNAASLDGIEFNVAPQAFS